MSTFVVARLTPDDWQEFRDVRLASLAESPWAFSASLAEQRRVDEGGWRDKLKMRVQFVVRSGAATVGTAGYIVDENGIPELVSMWVHPASRGQGAGDLIVRTVLDHAREQGYPEIHLCVTDGNQAAERLYARHGFVRAGESQFVSRETGEQLEFAMCCKL
jgi:ribosomal protein S18 acetylase RimI-like enzyme